MATYYAWSEIHSDKGVVAVGQKVSASDLGLDNDAFQRLVDIGSVREQKYPDVAPGGQSPTEHFKSQLAKMANAETEAAAVVEVSAKEEAPEK